MVVNLATQAETSSIDKDKWIGAERLRWARAFSIPMKEEMPDNFPPLTVNIMRALCAIQLADGESQERLVRTLDVLYHKYWVDHIPTHEPEKLRSVLVDILGAGEAEKGMQPSPLPRIPSLSQQRLYLNFATHLAGTLPRCYSCRPYEPRSYGSYPNTQKDGPLTDPTYYSPCRRCHSRQASFSCEHGQGIRGWCLWSPMDGMYDHTGADGGILGSRPPRTDGAIPRPRRRQTEARWVEGGSIARCNLQHRNGE
jgi:hypothetical protein